ncbi:hypothetical protein V8E51_008808 [Hyaloscypha variabilis]|jgi:hypothetical protein
MTGGPSRNKTHWKLWLLDQEGNRCGILYEDIPTLSKAISPKFSFDTKEQQQPKVGLVGLSKTKHSNLHQGFYVHAKTNSMIDTKYAFPTDTFVGINVLLVECKEDANGCQWAERISLGVIHKDAWEASNPQEKVIRLA